MGNKTKENKANGSNKIFDDYEVDCNECQRYWDSSCDGVPITKKRECTQFLATRSVVIPEQIKRLRKATKALAWAYFLMAASLVCHFLAHAFGW